MEPIRSTVSRFIDRWRPRVEGWRREGFEVGEVEAILTRLDPGELSAPAEELLTRLRAFLLWVELKGRNESVPVRYRSAAGRLRRLRAGPEHVEELAASLIRIEDEPGCRHAGLFLSALMNRFHSTRFVLRVGFLGTPPWFVGYRNRQNHIVVEGDLGDLAGYQMSGGKIEVKGKVGHGAGRDMTGGALLVRGGAGDDVGALGKGGEIEVEGDVGDDLGKQLARGSIRVGGSAGRRVGCGLGGGRILVRGGAGDHLGEEMSGGTIEVGGDVGYQPGYRMRRGVIRVGGRAGHRAGSEMIGGRIMIAGGAGMFAGEEMRGGRLNIGQDAGNYLGKNMRSGNIRVGGRAGDFCANQMKGSITGSRRDDFWTAVPLLVLLPPVGLIRMIVDPEYRMILRSVFRPGSACTILVKGAAGAHAGTGMEGGTLIVEGRAESVSRPDGGSISVAGEKLY